MSATDLVMVGPVPRWSARSEWVPKRCMTQDKDGHRCNQTHEHAGTHRAFGKDWA